MTEPEPRCSLYTRAIGEEPAGTAPAHQRYFIFELPTPWARKVEDSPHFPPGLAGACQAAGLRIQCIAPDQEYSRPDLVRVWHFDHPSETAPALRKQEYLLPPGQLVPLAEALGVDIAPFDKYLVDAASIRELLVCTHGQRDACCGSFGFPIYRALREQYAPQSGGRLRVWRTSHLGGHRFAPTIADFPEGRFWAHITPELLDLLVHRNGPVEPLRSHYRGWGLAGKIPEQLAEREAFMREGWAWTNQPKTITAGEGGQVRIEYPGGAYAATVALTGSILMRGDCGGPLTETPQYAVTDFRHEKQDGGLLP